MRLLLLMIKRYILCMKYSKKEIPVVILAGGLGTRLREETEYRPKPMVEVGGKPILLHIMRHYARFGFKRFIICVGYKGDVVRDYFLNYHGSDYAIRVELASGKVSPMRKNSELEDWEVSIVDTGRETLTGGRLIQIEEFIDQPLFLATYGDGLSNVNIDETMKFHLAHGCAATVTAVKPTSRFGSLGLKENGKVYSFREKELAEEWINGGFFIFNRDIFNFLDSDALEIGTMDRLVQAEQLNAFRHNGYWQCMDTPREFQELNSLWNSGIAPWLEIT